MTDAQDSVALVSYEGGCHCGAVTYEVKAPARIEVEDCNCSVCSASGYLHLIVPRSDFRWLTGESLLTTYRFNSGVAEHYFCSLCGIKPCYIPRSNPDGMDVNVRTLKTRPQQMTIVPFDGKNWEANAAKLAHKSRPRER